MRPIRTDRFYGSSQRTLVGGLVSAGGGGERLCARSLVIIQDPADHALDPHLPIRQRRVPSVARADPSF